MFPDGCLDVIFTRQPGADWRWFVSDLDEKARRVWLAPGCEHIGWRLRPGVAPCGERLSRALQGVSATEVDEARIAECCEVSAHLEEVMASLTAGEDTRHAARLAGTSLRTFQRMTAMLTGKSPGFWIRLGRARRAAALIVQGQALVEVAANEGFSDQAHMTREFRRWFGVTPRQVFEFAPLTRGILSSGFGATRRSHQPESKFQPESHQGL